MKDKIEREFFYWRLYYNSYGRNLNLCELKVKIKQIRSDEIELKDPNGDTIREPLILNFPFS